MSSSFRDMSPPPSPGERRRGGGTVPSAVSENAVDIAELFFQSMTIPKTHCSDFSQDGLHLITTHEDGKAVRWIDVASLRHRETILFPPTPGVSRVAFTQTSDRFWAAHFGEDTHLLMYSVTAQDVVALHSTSSQRADAATVTGSPATSATPGTASTTMPKSGGSAVVCLSQCPTSDTLAVLRASDDSLVLMHPLVNRPVAATGGARSSASHGMRHVRWSADGLLLCVGATKTTSLFDIRKLENGPVYRIPNASMFTQSAGYDQSTSDRTQCVGTDFHPNGRAIIATSHRGETVVVDPGAAVAGQQPVLRSYFHGHAAQQFVDHHAALPAQFVCPQNVAAPPILQCGMSVRSEDRRVLLYDGGRAEELGTLSAVADSQHHAPQLGRLLCSVALLHQDMPRTVAVNTKFPFFFVGGKVGHLFVWQPR